MQITTGWTLIGRFIRSFSPTDHRILTTFSQRTGSHRKADIQGWKQKPGSYSSKTFWWLKDSTEAERHSDSNSTLSNRNKTYSAQSWQGTDREFVLGQEYLRWENEVPGTDYLFKCVEINMLMSAKFNELSSRVNVMWLYDPVCWYTFMLMHITMQIIHMHC